MRRFLAFGLFAFVACGANDAPDNSPEWLQVLSQKRAAVAPNAKPHDKQLYADSLAAFTKKYPRHGRAREVYLRIQLEFARELSSFGRDQDAIRFYRSVLTADPANAAALRGLAETLDRLAISRDTLLTLQKGMSQREVAHVLGKPIPGWTVRSKRRDSVIDSWYYRTSEGGVAGVYFRDGELFAAEENSHSKVVPLSQAGGQ